MCTYPVTESKNFSAVTEGKSAGAKPVSFLSVVVEQVTDGSREIIDLVPV